MQTRTEVINGQEVEVKVYPAKRQKQVTVKSTAKAKYRQKPSIAAMTKPERDCDRAKLLQDGELQRREEPVSHWERANVIKRRINSIRAEL